MGYTRARIFEPEGDPLKPSRTQRPARPRTDAAHSVPSRTASAGRRVWWLVTACLAGAVAMSLEIAAARLLAPYVGSSMHVWGTLISALLAAMAVGYALGGRLADRLPGDRGLFAAILASGLYQAAALCWAHPLLRTFALWSDFSATLVASLAVFGAPVLLLAGVGPWVIRLAAQQEHVGTAAGWVYGLATAGSIVGVLTTTFLLLPELGTKATLQLLAGLSVAVGVVGLWPSGWAMAAVVATGAALPATPDRAWPLHTTFVAESIYHVVQVVQLGQLRGLVLDEEAGVQTLLDVEHAADGPSFGYWSDFAIGPLLVDGHDVLVLGMGGGASVRAVQAADPNARVDAVELDPVVVAVAAQHFGVAPGARLAIHVSDARRFLATSRARYDVIQADLFHSGATIPFHLATVEFYRAVRAHLRDGGVFMLNVFDRAQGRPLLGTLAATLGQVFSTLLVHSPGGINHIVLAFPGERELESVRRQLEERSAVPIVAAVANVAARELRELEVPGAALVLTDDHAPIEGLTRRMMETPPAVDHPIGTP